VKRLATVLLVLAAACARGGTTGSAPATGASSADAALNAFIAAAKAQDLQAMSAIWGTADGLARDNLSREELERRELIMMRMLCQDSHQVLGRSPGIEGRQILRTELTRGAAKVTINVTTVRSGAGRWYVEDLELEKLQAFCR
jgi:hypothetical protein